MSFIQIVNSRTICIADNGYVQDCDANKLGNEMKKNIVDIANFKEFAD